MLAVVVGPAWRDIAAKWIAGKIQHNFNERIETLRSELRKAEATFASEIRANERRFNSAVDVALGALSGRQSALDARRLQAVERLWAYKAKIDGAKFASQMMGTIDFEKAARRTATDPKLRAFFEMIDNQLLISKQMKEHQLGSVESERPYLSPSGGLAFTAR